MLFSRIYGQGPLKARLIGNVREGRVPHAQLFLGPRGSGGLPMALGYARYLLCQDQGVADACGQCASCVQMDQLAHPDLHVAFPIFFKEKQPRNCDPYVQQWREAVFKEAYLDLDLWREAMDGENKQLRMGVDIAQEINRKLTLKSFKGGYKVMLIWLPETMDAQASNKLLKVLEEPEPRTVFLMVAQEAERILPTILSRVQLVRVPALTGTDIAEALHARYPGEAEADLRSVAVRSEGDLLEAVAMVEKSEEVLFTLLRDWLRSCYTRKANETVDHSEVFAKLGREQQKAMLRYALYLVGQSVLEWQQVPELVRVAGAERAFTKGFSRLLDMENLPGIRQELETAHVHIERNANPKLLFMDLSYKMMDLLRR